MDNNRPTIQTIAEELGVHRSTVSRALNPDQAHQLKPETVRLVREVAERLGWERNPWARSLATNRSTTIGLLIPRLSDLVVATMFEAAEHRARQLDYQAVTVSTQDDPIECRRLTDHLLEQRVDGIILATARLNDPTPRHLTDLGVPFVLLNRVSDGFLHIRGDDELGGYLVGRHLISLGHRRIGVVAGPDDISTAVGRVKGLTRAIEESGLLVDPELVRTSTFRAESGSAAGAALLSTPNQPTAIFAVNDSVAIGVIAAARDLGISVPHQLAVVGYNDSEFASLLPTPLTSVKIPLATMGAAAVDMLLRSARREPVSSKTLTPRLMIRESSARSLNPTETRIQDPASRA